MSDSLGSYQDFVCSATVERSVRAGTAPPTVTSVLKAEAGIVNGKELYVWPSNDADTAALKSVIEEYSRAGTGIFAMYSRPLFLTNVASFYPAPEDNRDGKRLAKWEYSVPKEASKYVLAAGGKPVPEGYSGAFWADPDKSDVVRVELRADDVPSELGLKGIAQTIDYARGTINGVSVILPVTSDLTLLETGKEQRIKVKLENCHQYTTKSGMRFIETVVETPPEAVEGKLLPPKTLINLTLEDAVDEKTTTPGTVLHFKVTKDIKSNGQVIVKKGAIATGHLTRISRQSYRAMDSWKGYYIVGIVLDQIDAGDQKYHVVANLDTIGPATTLTCFLPFSQDPKKWGEFESVREELTFPKPQEGEAIFGVVREYLRLPVHLPMIWVAGQTPKSI